jgi:hypothetical protein
VKMMMTQSHKLENIVPPRLRRAVVQCIVCRRRTPLFSI